MSRRGRAVGAGQLSSMLGGAEERNAYARANQELVDEGRGHS